MLFDRYIKIKEWFIEILKCYVSIKNEFVFKLEMNAVCRKKLPPAKPLIIYISYITQHTIFPRFSETSRMRKRLNAVLARPGG